LVIVAAGKVHFNVQFMQDREISQRMLAQPWLKLVGSTVAISAFFVVYFHVLDNPVFRVRMVPVLTLDHAIPLVASSAWIYFSLWVYICVPTGFMRTRQALGHYLMGAFSLGVVGLSLFFIFPSAVPTWDIDWSTYPILAFLKESDAAGNACPSLHVAFAVFSGLWLSAILRTMRVGPGWHIANGIWGLAIVISTLTTKQHVLIDVICGIALGGLIYWLNRWWSLRRRVLL
jgi:hypothetical protein